MQAGIAMGAPQNAPQARMKIVADYAQSPSGQAKVSQDIVFQELLQEYMKQLQFQIDQSQNAEIGRLGTAPAAMNSTVTQGTNGAA